MKAFGTKAIHEDARDFMHFRGKLEGFSVEAGTFARVVRRAYAGVPFQWSSNSTTLTRGRFPHNRKIACLLMIVLERNWGSVRGHCDPGLRRSLRDAWASVV